MKRLKPFILFFILCLTLPAKAVLLMPWERLPLAIPLVVGEERVIFVDRNVRVGVPGAIADRLRVQTSSGTVYLLAKEPFGSTRLQLQDAETGELILIDIVASPTVEGQSATEPVRIVEGDNPTRRYGAKSIPAESSCSGQPKRETPIPVVLTRYAAQSLYAPLRIVEPVQGLARVNVRRDLELGSLYPTIPVLAKAAWLLEDYWVTAVKLKNTTSHSLALDPRHLQGDFVAATFQHVALGPAGQSTDTTVVYLVTRRHGLAESLLSAICPIDASANLKRGETP